MSDLILRDINSMYKVQIILPLMYQKIKQENKPKKPHDCKQIPNHSGHRISYPLVEENQ